MPHRDQAFRDSCGLCDEVAIAKCARCDLPLCKTHAPGRGARCTDCEGVLYLKDVRAGRIRGALTSLGVAAGSAVGTVAAFALGGWATTIIAGTLGIALSAFTVNQVGSASRSKRRRKKFLAEHAPKYEASVEEKPKPLPE